MAGCWSTRALRILRNRQRPAFAACTVLAWCAALWGFSLIPATAAPPPGYYLVWGDEFNGPALDTTKWGYWCDNRSWGKAYNSGARAVSVSNGHLVITTKTSGGTTYTAMVASDNHFRPRYGYYEASIQWGDYSGMWSAFWLRSPILGAYLNDPLNDGGEIDVCEHRFLGKFGTNIANIVSDNIHWNGSGPQEQSTGSPNIGSGLATGFHTYSLLWTTNSYDFGIDGRTAWHTGSDGSPPTPTFGSSVYIILSSEVNDGPSVGTPPWAGYIPPGGYPTGTNQMQVDYFRYYAPTNVLFWTGANSPYWNNSANWVANLSPLASSALTFSYLSAKLSTVLGRDYSVDGLIFLNLAGSVSIGGPHTLTLGASGIDMVAADQNVTLAAPLNLLSNQTWRLGRNNPGNLLTVNGSLGGSATLTKAGYGMLLLNGTNSFSGTLNVDSGGAATNDGVVVLTHSAALAHAQSPIYLRNTGSALSTLQLSNGVVLPQRISLAGRSHSTPALQAAAPGATTVLGGGLTLAGGGPCYVIQCDAGSLSLTGTVAALSSVTTPSTLTLQGNGAFNLSGDLHNGSPYPLSLVKSNSGSLTLSGSNSFTGSTTNWGGNLFVYSSLPGPLVFKGGALSGTGFIAGDTTFQSGQLSPGLALGNSLGTLTFGAALTLAPGSLTLMELNAAAQTNDVLQVAGQLTYGGTLYVLNLAGEFTPGQSFQLFPAGSYAGRFSALALPPLPAGWAWDTTRLALDGSLRVAAAPTVSVSPSSADVECPGAVTLNAAASGTSPLAYQWFDHQANPISGATNALLTLTCSALAQSGTYTVLVTNLAGSASSTAVVVLSDTTPPVLTLLGANPLMLPWHATFLDPGATALDACVGPLPVTADGTVDTDATGQYTLTYTATDPSGNTATASRTVLVVDPTLALTNLGGGYLQINWNYGHLQSATNLVGPYTDVPGAVAPYAFPATNDQQFFRVEFPPPLGPSRLR